jgi:hypothetical protein
MRAIQGLALAYFGLGALFATTVAIGVFSRFASEGTFLRPWILPLCIATAFGATLVARLQKRHVREL